MLKLACKITGFPAPSIKWLRDGNEIKVRKGVLVSQDAAGNATLVIEKAMPTDAGEYTAVGTNEVGKAETSCMVKVRWIFFSVSLAFTLICTLITDGVRRKKIFCIHVDGALEPCLFSFTYVNRLRSGTLSQKCETPAPMHEMFCKGCFRR